METIWLLVVIAVPVVFAAGGIALIAFVVRRQFSRRHGLTGLAGRLGLGHQRHADPWRLTSDGLEVDEVVYGRLDGVPVTLLTGSTGSVAGLPIAAAVDPIPLHDSVTGMPFPVRLDVRRGWLLIHPDRAHDPPSCEQAEAMLRLAARLGHHVPLRDPEA